MSFFATARTHLDQLTAQNAGDERAFREAAWHRAEVTGLPARKTETWKYSSLASLEKLRWTTEPQSTSAGLPTEWRTWLKSWERDFNIVVVTERGFQPQLSCLDSDITVTTLNWSEARFEGEDGFADLNAAIATPGLNVHVGRGVRPARPLLVVRYNNLDWAPILCQFTVEDNAELNVGEMIVGAAGPYLRADLNAVRVEKSAHLNWVRLQLDAPTAYHFNETQVEVKSCGQFHFTQVNRGAKWLRSQLRVNVTGENAETCLQGLTLAAHEQHIDQRVVVSHLAPNTRSEQLFKGVLKDRARGVTNGKIYIAQDAQKVMSRQFNHNLLLSPQSEADTKPELEIYADDVQANHGATVGRLDEEKMFYLASRGLKPTEAESLLSAAFVADIFMKIPQSQLRKLAEVVDAPHA